MLAVAVATTMVAACTLVSGWSDLQNGPVDSGKPPANEDASTNDRDTPTSDSSTTPADDSSAPAEGVPCGAQTCKGTNGCCVSIATATRSCTDRATCNPVPTRRFLLCAHSGQCPSDKPQCCLGFDRWDATCQNGCGPGEAILCDPAQVAKHCQPGEACLEYSATPDLYTCQ